MYDFNEYVRMLNDEIRKLETGLGLGQEKHYMPWYEAECVCDLCNVRKWNDTYDFIANFKVKGE